MKSLKKILPAWDWLSEYESSWLAGDAAAGVTVGVMLIPQAMAYAMLAGVEPIYGLYASVVPLIVYALLGTSRHLAVGTVAIDMLVVSAGVGLLAEPHTAHYAELAVLLAVMTGLIEIAMGVLRFGFLVNFLSRPVIAGFMTAAPLIIATSQLGNLIGVDLERSQYVHVMVMGAIDHVSQIHPATLVIGLVGVALLLAIQILRPRWPSALVWVGLALAGSWLLGFGGMGVDVVGEIPGGIPSPEIPFLREGFEFGQVGDLAGTAVTLALVQFMSVMSLGKVFEAEHDYTVKANKELIAIGSANVLGSLFRSIPVSGSFSRSAVNERAGANTPLANVFAAVLVGLTLLFLTPVFQALPIPALAAIIIVASIGMVDLKELKFLLQTRRIDGVLALVTFGATLGIGIQEGLLIGIGSSVLVVLYDLTQAKVSELGHIPGTTEFRNVDRRPEAEEISDIHLVRIDARFSFANAEQLQEELLDEIEGQSVRAVVMELSGVNSLDTTACAMLSDVVDELNERDVTLYVAGAKGPVRKVMRRAGLYEHIGRDRFFLSTHEAVKAILADWGEQEDYDYPGRQLEEQHEDLDEAARRMELERERMEMERAALEDELKLHEEERNEMASERDQLRRMLRDARDEQEKLRERLEAKERSRESEEGETETEEKEVERGRQLEGGER